MQSPLDNLKYRGDDPTGHGYYGAKRGTRKHQGVDIIAIPGAKVKAPIDGVVTKYGWPYRNNKPGKRKMRYVEITGDIYRVWVMYSDLTKFKVGDRIFKGQVFGKAQNVSSYWGGGMLNHLHIQVWKHGLLTDPEPLLYLNKTK